MSLKSRNNADSHTIPKNLIQHCSSSENAGPTTETQKCIFLQGTTMSNRKVNVHFNIDSVWGILDMTLCTASIFHISFAIKNSVI